MISGPSGTGKSFGVLSKLHYYCQKYPGIRCLIVRKTRESLTESVLVTYEEAILGEGHYLREGPKRDSRGAYQYKNGSTIVVAGLVQSHKDQRAKVMSTDYDLIYAPEAIEIPLDDWEKLLTRKRHFKLPFQQVIGDTNPDAPSHWIWQRHLAGKLKMHFGDLTDNPKFHTGTDWTREGLAYIESQSHLTGFRSARLVKGLWVQASGIVYEDEWADGPADGSVTEAAEYQEGAGEVVWAVDDGYAGEVTDSGFFSPNSHPRVFLLVQIRPNGQLCIFAEDYRIKTLSGEHLDAIQGLSDVAHWPEPDWAVVDKSAAELKGWLHDRGVPTKNSPPSVAESIKVLRNMLAKDKNGWRRILVHPRCKHLRQEMLAYRYGTDGVPVKEHDHGADCLRFLAWTQRHEQ